MTHLKIHSLALLTVIFTYHITPAMAEPTVIVNDQATNTQPNTAPNSNNTSLPSNPHNSNQQPSVNTNVNGNRRITPTNTLIIDPTQDAITQLATDNPNSVANDMLPTDSELSQANQKLLTENARLQREINDLDTRVNVLVDERSGQLFMYGAVSVSVALLLGFLLGWFIFGRRDRW